MEVCPNTATHFVRVTEDEDLWAAVLSWLPLADAVAAAQASRTHLPLLRLSKQNVRNLRLVLVQDKGFQNPRLRILEWEDDPSLIPDRFGGIADVGLTRCLLSKVTQCLPQLHRLQIDLSPPSNSLALDISPFACATRDLSPEADGRLQGCQPWRLLECAQVHDLEMTLHHPPQHRCLGGGEHAGSTLRCLHHVGTHLMAPSHLPQRHRRRSCSASDPTANGPARADGAALRRLPVARAVTGAPARIRYVARCSAASHSEGIPHPEGVGYRLRNDSPRRLV